MSERGRATTLATVTGLAAGWLALVVLVWVYGESPRSVVAQSGNAQPTALTPAVVAVARAISRAVSAVPAG